ncbi:hypothetical protein D9O36_02000 [Zobellia amurskyensis]|uniref:Uncharacterized protein n=2 Tax=Zobellia amurskyensis TaxID=248905 RepID=A0A7X2ZQM6_9FLAO|nr:hypothetical protein [Zobellia amurskyensis]
MCTSFGFRVNFLFDSIFWRINFTIHSYVRIRIKLKVKIMKKHILTAAVLAFALTACTGTKKATMNKTDDEMTAQQTSRPTVSSIENSSTEIDNVSGGVAAQTNGSTGAMNNVQATRTSNTSYNSAMMNSSIYEEIGMTEDQITAYEAAMENFENKKRNAPNGEMLGSIESERTRQMKSILSEDQFETYQNWEFENQ